MDAGNKLKIVSYSPVNTLEQVLMALTAVALGAGAFLFFTLVHSYSIHVIVLAVSVVVAVVLWKPVMGLAIYMIVYPIVPSEAEIAPLKQVMFGLTVLLLGIWFIQRSMHRVRSVLKVEYRWIYIFFLFLCLSPLIGMNEIRLTDWVRDIAPLMNILLIPVMVYHLKQDRNRWLLYLVAGPVVLTASQNILMLFDQYGLPFGMGNPIIPRLASLHPSIGFGIGFLMYIKKVRHRWAWMLFGVMNLLLAFLTPGRTIWITTATMMLLIIAFHYRNRLFVTLTIAALVAAMSFIVFFGAGSSTYMEQQTERFQQLREFQYDLSYKNRIEEMKQAGELFLSSPLYGVGFGYQYYFWRPFIIGIGPGYLSTNYTHSDIMFIASKGGLIGLILFAVMLYVLGRELLRQGLQNPGSLSALATGAFVTIINSLIIGLSTPVYQSRQNMFTITVLLALGLTTKGMINQAGLDDNYGNAAAIAAKHRRAHDR